MLPVLRSSFPFSPFAASSFDRLDSLFDRFFAENGDGRRAGWDFGSVPVSIWQDENRLYVEVELPGVTDKDVEITVHSGVLNIRAERQGEEGRAYLYNSRSFGRFEKSIVLPEAIDSDHVEATLNNGVLRVALPKHAEARPKKINLKIS
jgi:HSP20 family protein